MRRGLRFNWLALVVPVLLCLDVAATAAAAKAAPKPAALSRALVAQPGEVARLRLDLHRPGAVTVQATWQGGPKQASISLRAAGTDKPLQSITGPSPLVLQATVTDTAAARHVTWWIDVRADGKQPLAVDLRVSHPGGTPRPGTVRLRSADALIDDRSTGDLNARLAQTGPDSWIHGFVRLRRTPTAAERLTLGREGIEVQGFLGGGSYRARFAGATRVDQGLAKELITAAAELRPEHKVEARIAAGQFAGFVVPGARAGDPPRRYVLNPDGSVNLTVVFAAGTTGLAAEAILAPLASVRRQLGARNWAVTLSPDAISRLAAAAAVEWIEAAPIPPVPLNDKTRAKVGVETVQAIDQSSRPPRYRYSGSGDSDLVVAAGDGSVFWYFNSGTDEVPVWTSQWILESDGVDLAVTGPAAATFGDMDNDGDYDLLVGDGDGGVHQYENTIYDYLPRYGPGTPLLVDGSPLSAGPGPASPVLWDFDYDGARDLVVGAGDGRVLVFINSGDSHWDPPVFTPAVALQADGGDIDVGSDARPAFQDMDGDGDQDLLVGSADGLVMLFQNQGTDSAPAYASGAFVLVEGAALDVGDGAAPRLHDVDRDGIFDLTVGNQAGEIWLFRNTGTPAAPAFAAGVRLEREGTPLALGMQAVPVWRDMDLDGIRVLNIEDLFEWRHGDFEGRIVRRPDEFAPFNDDFTRHSTHVTGTMAGSGARSDLVNANGYPNGGTRYQWRGMLPGAGLYVVYPPSAYGGFEGLFYGASYFWDVQIANASIVLSTDGEYSIHNQALDGVIRGDAVHLGAQIPPVNVIIGAGNSGLSPHAGTQISYFSLTAPHKNATVVGAWSSHREPPHVLWLGSSLGPTYDGRIKPDLVAPGVGIVSADAFEAGVGGGFDGRYENRLGTSMASPVVAGATGLMLDAWRHIYQIPYVSRDPLRPATLRGLLIHGARDVDWVNDPPAGEANPQHDGPDGPVSHFPGPDFTTGWGLLDVEASLALVEQGLLLEAGIEAECEVVEFPFTVSDPGAPVTVTLTWDDVPADAATALTMPKLVNDLDLELVDPSGTVHYPYAPNQTIASAADPADVLTPQQQPCGTAIQVLTSLAPDLTQSDGVDYPSQDIPVAAAPVGKDHLNNVEKVVAAGAAGQWLARVTGFALPQAPQPFSLIGVPDTLPPEIFCHSEITTSARGPEGVPLHLLEADGVGVTATDFGDPYPVITHDATGPLGLGSHTVTYTATDRTGNSASCATVFIIEDTTAPTLACPATPPRFGATGWDGLSLASTAWTDYLAALEAEDDVDLSPQIVHDGPDPLPLGLTTVTFTARDDSSNDSEPCPVAVQVLRPADVVFVLDATGSMNQPTGDGTGNAKITSLRQAVQTFANVLGNNRQGLGDQVAALSFKVPTVPERELACQPHWQQELVSMGSLDTMLATVPDAVALMPTDGQWTPLRAGIEAGADRLAGEPAWRRRIMLLLTDGKQNTPNCTIGPDTAAIDAFADTMLNDRSIDLLAVGFGAAAQIDAALLAHLAGDAWYDTATSDQELDKWFGQALASVVEHAVVVDPVGSLELGERAYFEVPLEGQARSATFLLNWGRESATLELSLIPPGQESPIVGSGPGDAVIEGARILKGDSHRAVVLQFPLDRQLEGGQAGVWQAVVSRPGVPDGAAGEPYSLMVMADAPLQLEPAPPQPTATTDELPLKLRLWGQPLRAVQVTADVFAPIAPLGTALAELKLSDRAALLASGADRQDLTPQAARLALLAKRRGPAGSAKPVTVTLRDDGRHGDDRPGDGIFAGRVGPLTRDGPYSVVLRARGTTADGDAFLREHRFGLFVPLRPSAKRSLVRIERALAPARPGRIVLTPKDANGALLGPGHAAAIDFLPDDGHARTRVEDRGDGSYLLIITPDARKPPSGGVLRVGAVSLPLPGAGTTK